MMLSGWKCQSNDVIPQNFSLSLSFSVFTVGKGSMRTVSTLFLSSQLEKDQWELSQHYFSLHSWKRINENCLNTISLFTVGKGSMRTVSTLFLSSQLEKDQWELSQHYFSVFTVGKGSMRTVSTLFLSFSLLLVLSLQFETDLSEYSFNFVTSVCLSLWTQPLQFETDLSEYSFNFVTSVCLSLWTQPLQFEKNQWEFFQLSLFSLVS